MVWEGRCFGCSICELVAGHSFVPWDPQEVRRARSSVKESRIVFMMGGRWPYSWFFVRCCRQDLFNIAHKTGDISTLDGTSLKLVDKFTYLGSSVSSTEKDIDTRLTKAWTAIDKLSII